MRILLPILTVTALAGGCEFGDNRPLAAAGSRPDAAVGTIEPDAAASSIDGAVQTDAAVDAEACTLVAQTGCPAGRACDLADSDTGDTECRRIDRDGDDRSLCDDAFDCGAGFTCVDDPAGESSCLRYCQDEGDCDNPGGACDVELVDSAGDPIPGVTLCTQSCNPVTSNGCPPTWGCQVYTGNDSTACRPSGPGGHMAVCTGDEDCRVGYGCVNAGQLVCLRNCRVGVTGVCSQLSGTICTGYQDPAIIGGVEYGVCL
jgi:hypothetical protein